MINYEKAYKEALDKIREGLQPLPDGAKISGVTRAFLEEVFPELKESEDERIRKAIIRIFTGESNYTSKEDANKYISWLEKQKSVGEIVERCKNSWYNEGKVAGQFEGITDDEKYQQGWHDALETWKDMRLEGYQQASGNRHEPNYSDNSTKMFSLNDIDEIFENISEKQGEKKPVNDTVETIVEAVSNTSILDMIEDKDAFTNPSAFENSLGRLLKLFEKLPKQDLIDGLKFYSNVVEHDGEYVKPTEWSDEDEKIVTALMEGFRYHQLFNPRFGEVPNAEIIDWIKSLKERLS